MPSVLLAWCSTIWVVILLLTGMGVILGSELKSPVGIYQNSCNALYEKCDVSVCLDVDYSVGNAPYNSLGSLYDMKFCTLDSTVKLEAAACIFDHELFDITGSNLGFDICETEYENGVYIFEDTFDHWLDNTTNSPNLMKSATWEDRSNCRSTSDCGSISGTNALVFSGKFFRYIDTSDLDVSFGGFVSAEVFIAPPDISSIKYPK